MKDIIIRFLLRWAANTVGLWMAAQIVSEVSFSDDLVVLIVASFVLSLINAFIKPLLVVLSLPFIALSLGLFTIVINGVVVWLVGFVYDSFVVGSFTSAVLAGLIIGLVNYIATILLDRE